MSGPEHYREAERFVEVYEEMLDEGRKATKDASLEKQAAAHAIAAGALAVAQVHATLALAAASAPTDGLALWRKDGQR